MARFSGKNIKRASIYTIVYMCGIFSINLSAEEQQIHLKPGLDRIDLSKMDLTFEDKFSVPSVVGKAPFASYNNNIKWLAHTPWNGDFGEAQFIDPGPGGPFEFTNNGLRITARKSAQGKWTSGLICSVDRDGAGQQGFSQKFGYFEMRAKLPNGPGVWPAFWLVGVDKSNGSSEIDVLEYYGKFNAGFHTVLHLWKEGGGKHQGYIVDVAENSLTDSLHDYGVLITEGSISFFLDHQKYLEIETPEAYKQPMYLLANLALGGGWPINDLNSPATMNIEHIRVYKQRAY